MPADGSRHRTNPLSGLSFGGWGDYQLWADNGFLPKPVDKPAEEPTPVAPEPEPAELAAGSEPESIEPLVVAESQPESIEPHAVLEPWPSSQPTYLEPIDETRSLVRPYARTGGRTRTAVALGIETLLSVPMSVHVNFDLLRVDYLAICGICQTPHSTAEIAVHLGLPLGAAKVLISDAVDMGLLQVHDTPATDDGRPSLELLRRVHFALLRMA